MDTFGRNKNNAADELTLTYNFPGEPDYITKPEDTKVGDVITETKFLQWWNNYRVYQAKRLEPINYFQLMSIEESFKQVVCEKLTFERCIVIINTGCAVRCWKRIS